MEQEKNSKSSLVIMIIVIVIILILVGLFFWPGNLYKKYFGPGADLSRLETVVIDRDKRSGDEVNKQELQKKIVELRAKIEVTTN